MVTRKEKRELEKNINYFFGFIKIKKHFFRDINKWFGKIKDPRHQSYITYPPEVILIKTMRGMTGDFNKEECIENVRRVLGIETLEELPHFNTINNFLSRLDLIELEIIRTHMIKELLKKRSLEDYRISGKYWGIIFDGTGLFSFNERHCEHCLERVLKKGTEEEKTIYMHHVLEAKLVVGDMVLSIGSEFIENESEGVLTQDCELRAFYRLAAKIKETYKRLPICILGDSLYACEPVFQMCENYGWKYIFRFKEGRIKSVSSEFKAIKEMEIEEMQLNGDDVYWVNDIAYNERKVNVVEFTLDENGKKSFVFITDFKITTRNAKNLVAVGRSRWKIENEGFNNQKNLRYNIEYANSLDYTAMKNHYVLTQIADIIMQLFMKGLKIFKVVKKTAREISLALREAIRNIILTDKDISLLAKSMQVRFT